MRETLDKTGVHCAVRQSWVALADIPTCVAYGLFEPMQPHLDATLR